MLDDSAEGPDARLNPHAPAEADPQRPLTKERTVEFRCRSLSAFGGRSHPPAIVVGCGVTALGVLRCLGGAGIPTFYLPEQRGLACRSRWARPVHAGSPILSAERSLRDVLLESPVHEAVLIPCSDSALRRVARLHGEMAERFRSCLPSDGTIDTFVDKRRFAAFLRAENLPHPRTVEVERESCLDGLDDDIFETAFFKPRDSQRFFARYGAKAFRMGNRENARFLLRRFLEAGLSVVLQEYIPGPASSHLFLDGFVDRSGRITHLLTRRRIRMYPEDFGNSTVCETVRPESVQSAVDDLRRALAAIAYRGIFSAEMKRDARDGTYRFLEVNARAWWYVGFADDCGVNVCEAAYLDAQSLDVAPAPSPPAGIRLVYPSQDLAALRFERQRQRSGSSSPAPSTGAWFKPWLGARQPIWRLDDPIPAVWSLGKWAGARMHRIHVP